MLKKPDKHIKEIHSPAPEIKSRSETILSLNDGKLALPESIEQYPEWSESVTISNDPGLELETLPEEIDIVPPWGRDEDAHLNSAIEGRRSVQARHKVAGSKKENIDTGDEKPDDSTDRFPKDLPPNSKINIEGKTYYTDDNGNIYRIDDVLLPNMEYDINGYHYKTDEKGRIISVSGKLQKKNHDGRPPIKDSLDKIGRGDQRETDDRGHLIADRFNGGNGLENIVPMDSELNQHGDFGKLEEYLAEAVKNGDDVYVDIEVIYDEDTHRPTEFRITVIINGEKDIYVYKNEGGSQT